MVKADNTRDYYADLELQPTSGPEDIKKQFKKLALKYHPDRNPGKEVEFNSKFQAIQSAHEVLTDPVQRSKYDADRMRQNVLRSYATCARPNVPSRSPATQFAPPPSRTAGSAAKANFTPNPSRTGDRYTQFTRPNPSAWNANRDNPQTRAANDARAWERMKPSANANNGQAYSRAEQNMRENVRNSFPSGREPSVNGSRNKTPEPSKPSWAQFQEAHTGFPGMRRSNTTRTPRKQGFAPATPGGDEPPASGSSAYFNLTRGGGAGISRAYSHVPPPPPRGPASTARRPDLPNRFNGHGTSADPFCETDRMSTPYTTGGGERTYFSSAGLGRSSSSREHRRSDEESQDAGDQGNDRTHGTSRAHRSASPKVRSQQSYSTTSSSSEDGAQEEEFYTSHRKSNDERPNGTPSPQDGHRHPHTNPFIEVEDEVDDATNEMRSEAPLSWRNKNRDSKLNSPQLKPFQREGESKGSPIASDGFQQHGKSREAQRNASTARAQAPAAPPRRASATNEQVPQRPLERSRSWQEKYGGKENASASSRSDRAATGDQADKPAMYDDFEYHSFPTMSSLHEHLRHWPFFSIPEKPASQAPSPAHIASYGFSSASGATKAQHPLKWTKDNLDAMLNDADICKPASFRFPSDKTKLQSPPSFRSRSSESINTTFSPNEWSGKFTGNTEYFAPTPAASRKGPDMRQRTSPVRGRTPAQTPQQSQPSATNEASTMNDSFQMPPPPRPVPVPSPDKAKFSAEEWQQHFKDQTWTWVPPPPPMSPARSATLKRPKAPGRKPSSNKRQTIPKPGAAFAEVDEIGDQEPTAADSSVSESSSSRNSGDSNAMDVDTPPSAHAHLTEDVAGSKSGGHASSADRAPQPQEPPNPSRQTGTSRGETNEPHLDLNDLRNVEPLAPNRQGLRDLNDLSTTLPFESRPAHAIDTPLDNRPLQLPEIPRIPPAPQKLTQSSWERYLAGMGVYMFEWNKYNSRMLSHFQGRQIEVENTLGPNWMSAVGDGTYAKYMKGIEDDFRVREHWDLSWEKHRECMKALGRVRERLSKSPVVLS